MPYGVLIVDDSSFFQTRLTEIVNECSELKVVGVASNGQEAIQMAAKLKPDIISMDYEMPLLDGVSAVKIIMEENPTPIIMFSSMTYEGARTTLDALDAGALDFMNKNFAEVSAKSASFKKKFHEKLVYFAKHANTRVTPTLASAQSSEQTIPQLTSRQAHPRAVEPAKGEPSASGGARKNPALGSPSAPRSSAQASTKGKIRLLVIGASTGGPVALADIINALPANFPVPVLVIQHMPENFTKAFSERLNRQSKLDVKEAQSGDRIAVGSVLIAPGGKQMIIDKSGKTVKIIDGDDRVNYKPCVDITFASAAATFSDSVLALVLTGMGADGCEGARLLKAQGSTIWSQDQASSVVYGMPAAVAKAGLSACVLPLKSIATRLISDV